jgi:hypothetical protein
VENPELAGTLIFDATISTSGAVSLTVVRNDGALDAAEVTSCVVARMRGANFTDAAPEGGEVRARFGLSFRPASPPPTADGACVR